MNIAKNLNSIKQTKENLKIELRKKGQKVLETTPFKDYPNFITQMQILPTELKFSSLSSTNNKIKVECDEDKFLSKAVEGIYSFKYNKTNDEWILNGDTSVNLDDYGIALIYEPYKAPNYSVVGSPTITNDYVASGFTNSDYIAIGDFNPILQPWQIHTKFKTTSDVTSKQTVWGVNYPDTMGWIYEGTYRQLLPNISPWNTTEYRLNIEGNTEYETDCIFDGTKYTINLKKLSDGTTQTLEIEGAITYNNNYKMYIGSKYGAESFGGIIYLEDCYVKINDELTWTCYNWATPELSDGDTISVRVEIIGKEFTPVGTTLFKENATFEVLDEEVPNTPVVKENATFEVLDEEVPNTPVVKENATFAVQTTINFDRWYYSGGAFYNSRTGGLFPTTSYGVTCLGSYDCYALDLRDFASGDFVYYFWDSYLFNEKQLANSSAQYFVGDDSGGVYLKNGYLGIATGKGQNNLFQVNGTYYYKITITKADNTIKFKAVISSPIANDPLDGTYYESEEFTLNNGINSKIGVNFSGFLPLI